MADKVQIRNRQGMLVDAVAPVIISASRSTDIPAFFAKWFINRLMEGYCVWYNPFNQQPMYISFQNTKVVVFWTKNPAPLVPYLTELDKRGIHYYFQVTLNDYEKEHLEPNVPTVEERVATFRRLSTLVGTERVIWRFDPLIITPTTPPRELLTRIWRVGNLLKGCTDKLVFSFADVKTYKKVQNNLIKDTAFFTRDTVELAEPTEGQRMEIISGLCKIRDVWHSQGWNVQLATCAEQFDYERYGIEHNRCIDGELMEHLWHDDKELVYFLHTGELPIPDLFGSIPPIPITHKNLKDKGQRKVCGCMISKDIGMYNTCRHLCTYCYANTSKECVLRNQMAHSDDDESLLSK
ncbi:MAG: DUF1848 domain-containing protein [Paludibacteraceae bacterium]|nr:DUF1848 domain-containing protein [Paludibacteraceae bacterium]